MIIQAPEKSVLNKGLNFATTIKQISFLDLIAPIEDAAVKILRAMADELRWKVRQALEKSKAPKPNISRSERLAIKSLQDDNIIILPADKNNANVVMNRMEYSNNLADLIGNGGYCKVKKDSTLRTEKKLSQILGKNKDLIPQKIQTTNSALQPATTYIWSSEIHNDGIPLRSIVSNRGSACHPLCCFLVRSSDVKPVCPYILRTRSTSWKESVMLPFVRTRWGVWMSSVHKSTYWWDTWCGMR